MTWADFPRSRVSPSQAELDWLAAYLREKPFKSVVEFGCGVTTAVIYEALPWARYLAIEDFEHPGIAEINKRYPAITIEKNWENIELYKWDLALVDSSAGCGCDGLNRDKAAQAVVDHLQPGGVILIHDWKGRSGKKPRAWLESNGWRLVDHCDAGTGWGAYQAPIEQPTCKLIRPDDLPDVEFVTACDAKYWPKMLHVIPSWRKVKGWKGKILVFTHNVTDQQHKQIMDAGAGGPIRCVPFDCAGAETQRERMLTAHVFGVAKHCNAEYAFKLDAETCALNDDPWLPENFRDYNMMAQPWGYTKPGTWVPCIDYWMDGLNKMGTLPPGFRGVLPVKAYTYQVNPAKPNKPKHMERRVCSWVRMCRTQIMRDITINCPLGRMPVPSEDTLIWRWCERLGLSWHRFNFKAFGWLHSKHDYERLCKEAIDKCQK